MPKPEDLTGKRFGKLVVIKRVENIWQGNRSVVAWLCKCDCGNEKVVSGGSLRSGNAKSCGCLSFEKIYKHGGSYDKLYSVWNGIKQRCNNEKSNAYKNYGGRGISVCDEWENSYVAFRDWAISNGYVEGLEIDRIDNNGNYCPENCRVITHKEQQSNKRTNRWLTYNGETKTLSQWADCLGIKSNSLIYRIRNHGVEKALSLKGNLRGHKID